MVYTWTRWALRKLHDHGIEPWEVMQVLTGKHPRWPRRGRDSAGVAMLTIWGRTNSGRPLIVGVYQDPYDTWEWHPASAREMTADELAAFERWEETR